MNQVEVFWKSLDSIGLEHLHLSLAAGSHKVDGLVLVYEDGQALRIHYQVMAGEHWNTREVLVSPLGAAGKQIYLISDGKGVWRNKEGLILEDFLDCLDVDVQATPSPTRCRSNTCNKNLENL